MKVEDFFKENEHKSKFGLLLVKYANPQPAIDEWTNPGNMSF